MAINTKIGGKEYELSIRPATGDTLTGWVICRMDGDWNKEYLWPDNQWKPHPAEAGCCYADETEAQIQYESFLDNEGAKPDFIVDAQKEQAVVKICQFAGDPRTAPFPAGKWYAISTDQPLSPKYLHTDGIWYGSTKHPDTGLYTGYYDTRELVEVELDKANDQEDIKPDFVVLAK